jgi:hypothetical protein
MNRRKETRDSQKGLPKTTLEVVILELSSEGYGVEWWGYETTDSAR